MDQYGRVTNCYVNVSNMGNSGADGGLSVPTYRIEVEVSYRQPNGLPKSVNVETIVSQPPATDAG